MINIEEFKRMQRYIKSINSMDVHEIKIEGIEILHSVCYDFEMMGSNNTDLVTILIEASERGKNPLGDLWQEEQALDNT
jgi:hypothetical protein